MTVIFEAHASTHGGNTVLMEWARANGIDPDRAYAVKVLADGDGQIVVYEYESDAHGRRFVRDGEAAKREPYTVPLRTAPPRL